MGGFVWGYALVWSLLSDRVKLLAYRIIRPGEEGEEGLRTSSRPHADVCVTRIIPWDNNGKDQPVNAGHVSGHDRMTIEKIFRHPAGGNIERRHVHSVL